MTPDQSSQSSTVATSIVELRQYTLHPGRRDVLIELFDREFVESQEELGMSVIGQFRDIDDPDHFVWLRGFAGMTARAEGLGAFYGGPVWKAHRDVANSTMVDSDDVLLLRPARQGSGFVLDGLDRPPRGATPELAGLISATVCFLDAAAVDGFVEHFEHNIAPSLADSGVTLFAYFVTAAGPNNFPGLPIRDNEHVVAWFASLGEASVHADVMVPPVNLPGMSGLPLRLRLAPTGRSLLRGSSRPCFVVGAAIPSPPQGPGT